MSLRELTAFIKENVNNQTQTYVPPTETSMEAGDAAYAWLKNNHPDIHHYLKNHAQVPVDPVSTIRAIKQMGPAGAMGMIKNGLTQDTKQIYEPHSGAAWQDHIPTSKLIPENYDMFVTEGLDMDVTWKKHGDKIQQRLFDHDVFDNHKEHFHQALVNADPTDHKEYAPWIAKSYANGGEVRDEMGAVTGSKGISHLEDFGRVHTALSAFHTGKVKKQLTKNGVNADINTYKSLPDLEDAVDKIPKEKSAKDEIKAVKEGEATKYDTEHWTTIVPHTTAASCVYGAGTKWCTSGKNNTYFNSYNKDGPLQIMVPKNPKYPGEKYQYHLHSNQFMEPKDTPADPLDVFHGRPNPVVLKHVDDHQALIDASSGSYGGKDKARMIQVAHDPKKYLDKYATTGGADIQAAVARHGTPEQKEALINNPNLSRQMKIQFIKGGNPAHISKFANDTHSDVQAAVAEHGTDEHRDALVKNTNLAPKVVSGLIASKKSKYIEPFLDHKDSSVHQAIFTHGSPEQQDHVLYKNPHVDIGLIRNAIESKEPRHLDNFASHPTSLIRALVAKHGTQKHRDMLANDSSPLVKATVAEANKT